MDRIRRNLFLCAAVLLVLLLAAVASVSCSDDRDENYDDLYNALSQYYGESMSDTDEPSDADIKTVFEDAVIIIPSGCDATVYESAKIISNELQKITGNTLYVKYDSEYKSSAKNIEILVGATDREESRELLKNMRADDYGYRYYNGKFTVAAGNPEAYERAVLAFLSAIGSGEISASDIYEDLPCENIVRGKYSFDTVLLNGFDISEYTIVYPQDGSMNEKRIAQTVFENIKYFSGYILPIASDKECKNNAAVRAICIGNGSLSTSVVPKADDGQKSASISLGSGGHIELVADDAYGLELACKKFTEMMWDSKNGKDCALDIKTGVSLYYAEVPFDILLVRDVFDHGDLESYRNTVNTVKTEAPDVSVFVGLSDEVLKNLENNLGSFSSLGGKVFYNTAEGVECIEGKLKEVSGGAVYSLTFSLGKGESAVKCTLFGAVVQNGKFENDAEMKEMYASLTDLLSGYEDMPSVIFFDMPEYLEELFLSDFGNMKNSGDYSHVSNYYLNMSELTVYPNENKQISVTQELTADIVKVMLYN